MVDELTQNRPEVVVAYDSLAPKYAEYSSQRLPYLDAVDDVVIQHLKPHNRLLDLGAGDGRRLEKIMQRSGVSDAVAIEPSPVMARLCRMKAGVPVHEIFAQDIEPAQIGRFDVVTALWNVFGHIPDSPARLEALKKISAALKPGGLLILDVNNRHNATAYGIVKVLLRTVVDTVWFKESRGDATYTWNQGDKIIRSKGHLFTPSETEKLFSQARLKILKRFSLNYVTGEVSHSRFRGQLLYILTPH
ncbi:MAG: class I SAM-dependent methyltransferase [Deltaproteobacteria bacterium]|nr:class I SAM-dependent methyltransferase [Deltaproteobacteria bacterium]MBI3295901.1 class I SAM-dependent methyltransferase [Deltaproteobacteria bacterium]